MKKLFGLLFFVLTISSFAQEIVPVVTDTIGNSQKPVTYIALGSRTTQILDSLVIQIVYTGEIDIDRLIVTKGALTTVGANPSSTTFEAVGSPDTTTLTVDEAAAGIAAGVYSAVSTGLNDLDGFDAVKISIESGASGNDSSDPNKYYIKLFKYYRPSKSY
jgi:hypothetical protein